MHALSPGDVLAIFDRDTRPPKIKWHVCVCRETLLFLRINSNPLFRPNLPLHAADCALLKHDSYVEMARLFGFSPAEVEAAMAAGGYKGRLDAPVRRDPAHAAGEAATLTPEQKALIKERLTSTPADFLEGPDVI